MVRSEQIGVNMGIYIKGATLSVELKEIFKELDIMDNLIEVETPHGRLIDADAVTEKMWQAENESCFYELDDVVSVDDIDDAPTVIEAEVE